MKIVVELKSIVRKRLQKINWNMIAVYINFLLNSNTFEISALFKTIKNTNKLSVFGKNGSSCLSNFLKTCIFRNFYHIFRTSMIQLITEMFNFEK